jgi:hypothetical protein
MNRRADPNARVVSRETDPPGSEGIRAVAHPDGLQSLNINAEDRRVFHDCDTDIVDPDSSGEV